MVIFKGKQGSKTVNIFSEKNSIILLSQVACSVVYSDSNVIMQSLKQMM